MTLPNAAPTSTDLMAACVNVLESGGYRSIREGFPDWTSSDARLFEDEYNVVGVAVFGTCAELRRSWPNLQASLIDLISAKVGLSDKSWDGYLVLLSPGTAPTEELEIEEIRRDTTRLRKLVATGEDIRVANDVARVLRPLLPLATISGWLEGTSALDQLPDLLAENGIERGTTALLVRAFLSQHSMIEALHEQVGS